MKELTKSAYFKDAKILCGLTEEDQIIRMMTYIDSPYDYMRYPKKGALVIISGWSEYFETEGKRQELLHNLRDLEMTLCYLILWRSAERWEFVDISTGSVLNV